jgi:transposase
MTAPRSGIGLHGSAPSRYKIERVFCRLKAARRIATRYGKCADNFLSAVCLIAAIYFWLN